MLDAQVHLESRHHSYDFERFARIVRLISCENA